MPKLPKARDTIHKTRHAARGRVSVHDDECKGCALCVHACPVHGLQIASTRLNRLGYHPVEFLDEACTGCGVCFYACPEPGALRVIRQAQTNHKRVNVAPPAEPREEQSQPAPGSRDEPETEKA